MRLRPKSVKSMTIIIMKKNTMPMACQNDRRPKYRQNLYYSGIHSCSDYYFMYTMHSQKKSLHFHDDTADFGKPVVL